MVEVTEMVFRKVYIVLCAALLAAGLVIWCGSWPLIFRGAAARYEKVDL